MGKRDAQEQCIDYARSHPEARNAELAERFGVAAKTIGRWLKAAGVKRTRGRPKTGKATKKKKRERPPAPRRVQRKRPVEERRPGEGLDTTGRNAPKERALECLLGGMTTPETADAVGVDRGTVWRWMQDSDFTAELERLRQERRLELFARLDDAATEVLEALLDLARNAKSEHVRRAAASDVLTRVGLARPVVVATSATAGAVVSDEAALLELVEIMASEVLPVVEEPVEVH